MTVTEDELAIAACHEAMDRGRQMVLDDLEAHPTRSAEHYALIAASCVHSTLMNNARAHLLAKLADNPTMAGRSSTTPAEFLHQAQHLGEMRDAGDVDRDVWACGIQDLAVGIAQAADELFQADGDSRGCPGASVREFVFQYVYPMPEHTYVGLTTPVVRRSSRPTGSDAQPAAPAKNDFVMKAGPEVSPLDDLVETVPTSLKTDDMPSTMDGFVEQWLDAKGVSSRAERSRQGSSARLFVEAMGLSGCSPDRLIDIGSNAAQQFVAYARATPLKARGERARIAHIKNFIGYARRVYDAVPELDWTNVQH